VTLLPGTGPALGVALLPATGPGRLLALQALAGNQAVGTLLAGRTTEAPGIPGDARRAEASREALPQQSVELDMDGDEEAEPHTLLIDPDSGELLLQSDSQTLAAFLKKYKARLTSARDQLLLKQIEADATLVHLGRYGTKYVNPAGYQKTKAPTAQQRAQVKVLLKRIATNLQQLLKAKLRPRSHKAQHATKAIGGDIFCEKIVMEPLSLLPRDDKIRGGPPEEETQLWRDLTNIAGYKRGHMLSEHIHGPGTNDNLVPISTAFNSTMREGVEKAAKEAVNSQNKVVRFEAEAVDWGQFPGAFGFPDEKKLPNKFHFKLTKMQKAMAGTGSQRADWNDTGTVLYEDTPVHNVPTDVVKGVVAPTVMTFKPGLYFFPFGSIKPAPPNFHLRGSFNINNLGFPGVLAGLGIDDEVNLSYGRIDATVLTEYQLPPGYGLKALPPTEIQYIRFGKKFVFKSPDLAFVVYNVANEARLKKEHQDKLDAFEEEQRILAQKQLDREQQDRLRQLQFENERKLRAEEKRIQAEQEELRKKQNDQYRHSLLAQIRTEAAKYMDAYGAPFKEQRERILHTANSIWKVASNLSATDMDTLLAPVRHEVEIAARDFKVAEERVTLLTERFDSTVKEHYMPQIISSDAARHFTEGATELFGTYDDFWRRKGTQLARGDVEQYWGSVDAKLGKLYEESKKRDRRTVSQTTEAIIPRTSYNLSQMLPPGTLVELIPYPEEPRPVSYQRVRILSGDRVGVIAEIRTKHLS
jgi:hypothetical protein